MRHVPNQAVLFEMMIGIVAAMGCVARKAPVEGQEIRRRSGRVVRRAGAARPRRRLTHSKPTRPRTGATSWPIFFPLQVTHATRKFCPRPEYHPGKAARSPPPRITDLAARGSARSRHASRAAEKPPPETRTKFFGASSAKEKKFFSDGSHARANWGPSTGRPGGFHVFWTNSCSFSRNIPSFSPSPSGVFDL